MKMHQPLCNRTVRRHYNFCIMGALLAAFSLSLTAQESEQEDDVVFEMNPFEVSTSAIEGYFASETTTGTRIASNIQELPFAVNVVTAEFFDDFQAYDLDEQFAYTTSFVADGEVAQYYLRGFRASFQLRNGFARAGMFSKVTTNRAEVIKGPVAAIYGRTQPGGVVNYVTKRPSVSPDASIRASIGTDSHYRVALSKSGPITGKNFLYRFDTSYRYEEIPQGGPRTPYEEEAVLSGVLQYDISKKTRLTVEMDRTERTSARPSRVPVIYQDRSTSQRQAGEKRHLGLAYDLVNRGLNNLPGTEVKREVSAINLMIEHKFNDVWTFRAAADYADRMYEDREMYAFVDRYQVRNRLNAPTNLLINREPRLWTQDEEYSSAAADLLASFWTGRIEHKLLFTTDFYNFENHTEDYRLTNNQDPVYNEQNMDVDNPLFIYTPVSGNPDALDPTRPDDDPGPFRIHSINTRELSTMAGFMSWRTASMDGRLITLTGVRREKTTYSRFYEVRAGWESIDIPEYDTYATTMQAGFTFKLTPEHYFFVGYSESYDPSRRVDLTGNPLPDEEGAGIDIGFKSSLRDGKMNLTFTVFSIDRENVAYEIDEYDETQDRYRTSWEAAGLVKSEGFEADFNFRLLEDDRLNIFGGYGYNDTEVREAGRDIDLIGRRWERVPLQMFKLGGRYSFRNTALHGLILTGGFRYNSSAVYENGVAETLATDEVNERSGNDGRREIIEPSATFVDIGGSYSWKAASGYRHTLQLNVKNLFDFDTPTNGGRIQDPLRVIFQYRIDF